ncbi:MAG TPA: HAD-IC family P-type ATPase, partial [Candidatus Coprousia avicola]|nr:HAD-IC family P-type ATPase [Candidatus Coprousia avicola]
DASSSLLSWIISVPEARAHVNAAILSTVGALLGMIPQGLVLLTSSVLAIATVRLARRKVLAQQLYCIETLARVDVLCLDKTGTITSGRMEVAGTHPLPLATGSGEIHAGVPAGVTALDYALANIARATSEDANETARALLDYYAQPAHAVPEAEVLRTVAFSSAKKWSGATFRDGSFVMGAAQFVLGEERYAEVEGEVSRLAATCRVLVVAAVSGFTDEGDMVGDAVPLGFVTIRDEIRSSASETIAYFIEQGVTLNVISGDDPRTVSGIAQVVGIPGASAYVDATTLDTPAKIDQAVDRYHVFGRVTPMQKRELVQALKRRGHTVAMTGDGVNDVLALKEADCSVAMAAGSDAARNVAEIVLVDNDFAAMPAVVAEGRRSINNLQRSAALFLTKTLFSMGLAAICIAFPPYPFQPIQMTLINFFCIGYPGFVLGLEANRARVEGNFLTNVVKRALPAALGVLVGACLNMALCSFAEFSAAALSTMCLVTTSAVGCCLIARISWPFTPLRIALFISIVVGIAVGIIGFADFFSIARLSLGMAIELVVVSLLSCALFFALARAMDRLQPRRTHSASGFGRGVQVKMGRSGMRSVRSTRSALRRFWWRSRDRFNRYVGERRHEDAAAADHAFRAEGSAPKLPEVAAAPHRSRVAAQADGAEGADGKREHMISSEASDHGGQEAAAAPSRPRKTAKRTKSGFSSVTKSSHGIHVTMPARKKR